MARSNQIGHGDVALVNRLQHQSIAGLAMMARALSRAPGVRTSSTLSTSTSLVFTEEMTYLLTSCAVAAAVHDRRGARW
eukprot:6198476-Pleurochrysis_carterae.AAC.3